MTSLREEKVARNAFRWKVPPRANTLWTLFAVGGGRIGPFPAPLLAWAALAATVAAIGWTALSAFSPRAVFLTVVAAAPLAVLTVRAAGLARPHWDRWWRIYLATASGAGANVYETRNPTRAWFTYRDGREVVLAFPEGSPAARYPSGRHDAEKAVVEVLESHAAPGETILAEWVGPATLRVWVADAADAGTRRALTAAQLHAAANEAAGVNITHTKPRARVAVEEWDDEDQPSRVVITATGERPLVSTRA